MNLYFFAWKKIKLLYTSCVSLKMKIQKVQEMAQRVNSPLFQVYTLHCKVNTDDFSWKIFIVLFCLRYFRFFCWTSSKFPLFQICAAFCNSVWNFQLLVLDYLVLKRHSGKDFKKPKWKNVKKICIQLYITKPDHVPLWNKNEINLGTETINLICYSFEICIGQS